MNRTFWARFWILSGIAAITGILAIITPFAPDWIEVVSAGTPISATDRSSGSSSSDSAA